jgi:DNA polymerase-3 subunit beta
MKKDGFPALPDISGATQFKIKQSDLKDLMHRTAFSVSREDSRFALTGLALQIAQGKATFTGTDGKRLARAHTPIVVDAGFSQTAVIPVKAVDEIINNLTDEGEATVSLLSDKIAVEGSGTVVISKLLAGEYPDVNSVIPERSEHLFNLHREELMSLLRQVVLFCADSAQSVAFRFSEGDLMLTANTADIGEGKVNMPVNYKGPAMDIAFNPGFFLDILRHSKEETVTMGITDPFNPSVITDSVAGGHKGETSPLFVLMPMRLKT